MRLSHDFAGTPPMGEYNKKIMSSMIMNLTVPTPNWNKSYPTSHWLLKPNEIKLFDIHMVALIFTINKCISYQNSIRILKLGSYYATKIWSGAGYYG